MADKFRLNNGMTIPEIGFGTYKAAADGTERVISEAIWAGYRYFDTASFYGTEEALGKRVSWGTRRCARRLKSRLKDSGQIILTCT